MLFSKFIWSDQRVEVFLGNSNQDVRWREEGCNKITLRSFKEAMKKRQDSNTLPLTQPWRLYSWLWSYGDLTHWKTLQLLIMWPWGWKWLLPTQKRIPQKDQVSPPVRHFKNENTVQSHRYGVAGERTDITHWKGEPSIMVIHAVEYWTNRIPTPPIPANNTDDQLKPKSEKTWTHVWAITKKGTFIPFRLSLHAFAFAQQHTLGPTKATKVSQHCFSSLTFIYYCTFSGT